MGFLEGCEEACRHDKGRRSSLEKTDLGLGGSGRKTCSPVTVCAAAPIDQLQQFPSSFHCAPAKAAAPGEGILQNAVLEEERRDAKGPEANQHPAIRRAASFLPVWGVVCGHGGRVKPCRCRQVPAGPQEALSTLPLGTLALLLPVSPVLVPRTS